MGQILQGEGGKIGAQGKSGQGNRATTDRQIIRDLSDSDEYQSLDGYQSDEEGITGAEEEKVDEDGFKKIT